MDAVIRAAELHGEPVLLAIEPVRPAAAAPPARGSLARPASASAFIAQPAEPSTAAQFEAELRRRLDAERDRLERDARECGLASGHAQGLEAGRTQGREQGHAQGHAEWAERIAALDRLLASTGEALESAIAGSDDLMIEIAFEAVCKILGAALVTRDGVAGVVRQALGGVRERERVVIHLAPRDVETLAALRGEMTRLAGAKTLEIAADERIELGGCLIETTGGGLDARLETQMRRLRDVLAAARASVESPT